MNEGTLASNGTPDTDQEPASSQADLYDALRKIGELEDKKQSLQDEINQLTDRLSAAYEHLDKRSLLHKMLTAALPQRAAPSARNSARSAKKTPRKKKAR